MSTTLKNMLLASTLAVCMAGCLGKSIEEANPVMGPAPPRFGLRGQAQTGDQFADSDAPVMREQRIQPAGYSPRPEIAPNASGFSESNIVATVNGQPIFADDVLEPFRKPLQAFRKQAGDGAFQQQRRQLLKQHLPNHVDREIMLQAMRSEMEPEIVENVDTQLDKHFEEYLDSVAEKLKVSSRLELEKKLAEEGSSMRQMRRVWGDQQKSIMFLQHKAQDPDEPTREAILAEYKRRIDEYTMPERVKWQQIVVYFDRHGGKEGAKTVMRQAWIALGEGTPFSTVARNHSDGATAAEGGHWDWLTRNSLADQKIERTLFELPVGKLSNLIVRDDRYEVVRVTKREQAHTKPFTEVQDAIKEEIIKTARQRATQDALADIRNAASVETIFDHDASTSEPGFSTGIRR